jgi:hypothetical protein
MIDDAIALDVVDGELDVAGPETALTPEVVESLRDVKDALRIVAEVFPGTTVVDVTGPMRWPPKGGFVPAWRRLRGAMPLVVLPSEHVAVTTGSVTTHAKPFQEAIFETGAWQVCTRCNGRRWRTTPHGDVCVTCPPLLAQDPTPSVTVTVPNEGWESVCAVCGGKNRCRPDHDLRLRQVAARMLRLKSTGAKRRAILEAALDRLPIILSQLLWVP